MPWIVAGVISLIGYRATVHVGDELGDQVKSALPYVAAGIAAYVFVKRVM